MADDLLVFFTKKHTVCEECGETVSAIVLEKKRAICLSCADLDHLEYLPAGDAALTRRARKHSGLSAVAVEWARARKRYERQGVYVEPAALDRAEEECRADEAVRAARRARAAVRRGELDREFVARFAARVRELFPGMPAGVEAGIAEHACRKHSGRVGRSADAKALEAEAVALAVVAHVRHRETPYDRLLSRGFDRRDARAEVSPAVDEVIGRWKAGR